MARNKYPEVTVEKILDVVKAIGIAILSWKVSSAITNLFKNLGIFKGNAFGR